MGVGLSKGRPLKMVVMQSTEGVEWNGCENSDKVPGPTLRNSSVCVGRSGDWGVCT